MNDIALFDFNGAEVRTLVDDQGLDWFVAHDIAGALEYRDTFNMTRLLADDEAVPHIVRVRSESGVEQRREMTIINEPGLYRAIFSSRSDKAETFRRWVFHEVLPNLRQKGHHAVEGSALDRISYQRTVDLDDLCRKLKGRSATTAADDKVLSALNIAAEAAGLPLQFYNGKVTRFAAMVVAGAHGSRSHSPAKLDRTLKELAEGL